MDLHVLFLESIKIVETKKKKTLEVIVTALDSLHHPEIFEVCGVNMHDIIKLMDSYSFTLQVEDPLRSWNGPPDRYHHYQKTYQKMVKNPKRLMFDVNVVNRKNIKNSHYPSSIAIGSELAQIYHYAAMSSNRVGIYSEITVQPYDMELLSYITGTPISIKEKNKTYDIESSSSFELLVDNLENMTPVLNGKPWPFFLKNRISIPAGKQRLSFKNSSWLRFTHLEHQMLFDGDTIRLLKPGNPVSFEYGSETPAIISLKRSPQKVILNKTEQPINPDRNFIILAAGNHQIELYRSSPTSQKVEIFGYLTSSLFLILGIVAVFLLVLIYVYVKFKK